MANYISRRLDITDISLSTLKIGSRTLCDLTPTPPEQVYVFTFYKGIKLAITDIPLSALKIGIISGGGNLPSMVNNMGIRISMPDLPMSNLPIGIVQRGSANMAVCIWLADFSVG